MTSEYRPTGYGVVLLAGATGRVGGAAIAEFARRGAQLAVVSRSHENAVQAIQAHAPSIEPRDSMALEADLRVPAAAQAAVAAVVERFGRLDALVSLAGGGSPFVSIVDSTFADVETSFRNNLGIAYNLSVAALRAMLAQTQLPHARSRGRLVCVTAGSSIVPQPRYGIMGAGKAGVNVLMRAIAREHKADGIVANALVLGGVATEAARAYLNEAEFAAAASPQEVADALAFHASDASSGINGELIHLNARETD